MRTAVLALLLVSTTFAQTAVYPGAVVTDNQLRVAANLVQTTLGSSIGSTDTTATLASGSGVPVNTLLTIDSEIVAVCAVSGPTITIGKSSCPNVDGRNFDGTSATSHAAGAPVALFIDSWYVNSRAAEIKAIEQTLGANLANVLSAGGSVSVMSKGAHGDGTTPDDASFAAAFTAACANPTGRVIYLPPPPVAYLLTVSYPVPCDFLTVAGTWESLTHYTGTGPMWTSTIAHGDNLRITGLKFQGPNTANTYFFNMVGTGGIGTAKIIIDKCWITGFGDVATQSGGGIAISSDSAGAYIANNVLANNGTDILINAASDTTDISDNFMSGSGWCVSSLNPTGAAEIRVDHNNMTCTKGGINASNNFAHMAIRDNEFETIVGLTGPHSAVFDLANGIYDITGNYINTHSTMGNYGVYFADDVIFSNISGNHLVNNAVAGVRVGAATSNNYHYNTTDGSGPVYSADTLGIQHHGITSGGAEGVFWGTETGIGPSPFHLVGPNAAYNAYPAGQFSISSSLDHNTLLLMGYDNTCPTSALGCGFLKAMKSGVDSAPLWLSPPPLSSVNGPPTLVGGGIQEASVAAKPTCSATTRGMFFAEKGTTGVHDLPWVCAKTSSDTYLWVAFASVP